MKRIVQTFFLSANRCSATQSSSFLNAQSAVLLQFSKEDKTKRKEASNIRFLVTLRYQMTIFPIQFQAKQIVTAQELSDFTQLFSSNKFYFTQTLFIN
jgi:hypothetical protein